MNRQELKKEAMDLMRTVSNSFVRVEDARGIDAIIHTKDKDEFLRAQKAGDQMGVAKCIMRAQLFKPLYLLSQKQLKKL